MSAPVTVDVDWLAANQKDVLILDVAYSLKPKPDPAEFAKNSFGKFAKLMEEKKNADYEADHIVGAVHFDIDVAFFPADHIRFGLYDAERFSEYCRLLGVNENSRIVVYGRGPAAGMLFASRAFWAFKLYGFDNISILNGGFEAWKGRGLPSESGYHPITSGNWSSKGIRKELLVTFEELHSKDAEGESLFDKLETVNYLDARPHDSFVGKEKLPMPAKDATGSHIKGSKNVPLSEVVGPNGMKSKDEIDKALRARGYVDGKCTYVACNGGIQAALLFAALASAGHEAKLFNGSLTEVASKASFLINGTSS